MFQKGPKTQKHLHTNRIKTLRSMLSLSLSLPTRTFKIHTKHLDSAAGPSPNLSQPELSNFTTDPAPSPYSRPSLFLHATHLNTKVGDTEDNKDSGLDVENLLDKCGAVVCLFQPSLPYSSLASPFSSTTTTMRTTTETLHVVLSRRFSTSSSKSV